MPAVLSKGALNTTPLNTYEIDVAYEMAAVGVHHRRMSVELAAAGAHKRWQEMGLVVPGLHNIVIMPYVITADGVRLQRNELEIEAVGPFDLNILRALLAAPGVAKQFATYTVDAVGLARHYNDLVVDILGRHRMLTDYEVVAVGLGQCGMGHTLVAHGTHGIAQPKHTRVYRQAYHVEDDSLNRWELYVDVGAVPDFDAVDQPVATGTTSPITWTPPLPGAGLTHTLYIVVRKRTSLGLLSFNQHPILVEIDENGDEVYGPLTAPELVGVLDGATSGSLQAWGRYPSGGDRDPADSWELYAVAGADPVIGVDAPLKTAAMGVAGGGNTTARLAVTGLTPGTTYHVRLAVRRGADDAYAASTVTQITLIPVYEVVADDAAMFGGDEYEIHQ